MCHLHDGIFPLISKWKTNLFSNCIQVFWVLLLNKERVIICRLMEPSLQWWSFLHQEISGFQSYPVPTQYLLDSGLSYSLWSFLCLFEWSYLGVGFSVWSCVLYLTSCITKKCNVIFFESTFDPGYTQARFNSCSPHFTGALQNGKQKHQT